MFTFDIHRSECYNIDMCEGIRIVTVNLAYYRKENRYEKYL